MTFECRLDAGHLAGFEAIAAVDERALWVKRDRAAEAADLDVGGEVGEPDARPSAGNR